MSFAVMARITACAGGDDQAGNRGSVPCRRIPWPAISDDLFHIRGKIRIERRRVAQLLLMRFTKAMHWQIMRRSRAGGADRSDRLRIALDDDFNAGLDALQKIGHIANGLGFTHARQLRFHTRDHAFPTGDGALDEQSTAVGGVFPRYKRVRNACINYFYSTATSFADRLLVIIFRSASKRDNAEQLPVWSPAPLVWRRSLAPCPS